jgi:Mg2+ and Co2+ transporter CorA
MMLTVPSGIRRVAEQVVATQRRSGRDSWRSVSSLLSAAGAKALTPAARESITKALADQGIVVEPPLTDLSVGRSVRVRLRSRTDAVAHARAPLAAATSWGPTRSFGDVAMYQVDPEAPVDAALAELAPHCVGLDRAALAGILEVDSVPGVAQFEANDGTTLVKVITFGLAETTDLADWGGLAVDPQGDEDVIVQPVEMLAGPGWVICCWHNSELLGDPEQSAQQGPVASMVTDVLDAVQRRLPARAAAPDGHSATAVEVSLRIAERLSRQYGGVVRHVEDLVDAWGVEFGHRTAHEERGVDPRAQYELSSLQVRVAGLLRRLRPLASQLESEMETLRRPGWATADQEHERALRWQRALTTSESRLLSAADDVRANYQLMVVAHLSEQLRRTEEMRRSEARLAKQDQWFASLVAIGAAVLLVPATVAGIWGMNVGVPGEGETRWFWIVLILMLAITALIIGLFVAAWARMRNGTAPPPTGSPQRDEADPPGA